MQSDKEHPNDDSRGRRRSVDFTLEDKRKILTGVAPTGSSKTKARRVREAAAKRRRLSQAALKAVIEAGGDVDSWRRLKREKLLTVESKQLAIETEASTRDDAVWTLPPASPDCHSLKEFPPQPVPVEPHSPSLASISSVFTGDQLPAQTALDTGRIGYKRVSRACDRCRLKRIRVCSLYTNFVR
jgi:hypothetical protein